MCEHVAAMHPAQSPFNNHLPSSNSTLTIALAEAVRTVSGFKVGKMPGLTIGDTLPDLELDTTHGKIKLHDFVGDGWAIIFSHPGTCSAESSLGLFRKRKKKTTTNCLKRTLWSLADFTPVCTTELAKMAEYAAEFEKRGVKLLGISCDDVESHRQWTKDIEAYSSGHKVNYPIAADPKREVIRQLNMVDPDEKDPNGTPLPSRALHIVGPDKRVKLSFLYPSCAGRNMDEVLRAVDSLQASAKCGDACKLEARVSNEQAEQMFPQGFKTVELPSKKQYLRFTNVKHTLLDEFGARIREFFITDPPAIATSIDISPPDIDGMQRKLENDIDRRIRYRYRPLSFSHATMDSGRHVISRSVISISVFDVPSS
ncbi:1-Cys peroxiredoxin [Asimina triloba]